VRDVECEALTLLWLNKSEAGFDGIGNQLKVFAAHCVLLLCWGQSNYRNEFDEVKFFFLVKRDRFVGEGQDSCNAVYEIDSQFNTLRVMGEQKIVRLLVQAREKNY
jgi:hypothetical protein